MTFPNDYEIIRNQLIESAKRHLGKLGLELATNDFRDIINSQRRSSCIRSFEELLSVLEKRGHVGAHSIQGLRTISDKLNDIELDQLMSHYEELLESYPRTRVYENQYARSMSQRRLLSSSPTSSLAGSSTVTSAGSDFSHTSQFSYTRQPSHDHCDKCQIPESAITLICDEIGKQWMEFARKLGLREGEIDSINDKYSLNLKTKAREVLKLFMQRTDPVKWQCKLLDGLVQARRRDLKESVEEILMRRHY